MPTIDSHGRRRRHGVLLVVLVAVLVLAVVGVFAYIQYQRHVAEQQFNRLQTTTQAMVAGNHAREAAELWVNYAQDMSNPQKYRVKAWENAGLLYMSSGHYSNALTCFQTAAGMTPLTYTLATEIAQAAARAGNKQVAIQYYKEALKRIPPDMVAAGEQKQFFNKQIQQLEQPSP